MEKGIRQKRYQKFTKNGKEWTEWFDWSGEEPEWQLKGRLRNEYRTIYPSGGSSLDGQGSSRADDGKAATANGNSLQPSIFPEGSLNYHKEGKQPKPLRNIYPRRKRESSLQERNKRNWMQLFSPGQATATKGNPDPQRQQLSLFP
jgi:hypothetical protein